MTQYIGLDPGNNGYFCIIHESNRVEFIPLPVIKIETDSQKKKYNLFALNSIFKMISCSPAFMVIEHQHAFKNQVWAKDDSTGKNILLHESSQGISSTGRLLEGFGAIQAFAIAHGIDHKIVSPQKWQKHLFPKIKMGWDTKKISIAEAKKLYPEAQLIAPGARVENHNRADALLIAHYGKKLQEADNGMILYKRGE